MKRMFLAAALALLAWPLHAQTPPNPPPTSYYPPGTPVSLVATNAGTDRVQLPAAPSSYPVITIVNVGAVEVFCKPGDATVTSSSSAYQLSISPNSYRALWDKNSTYVSCAVVGGTSSTVRITQSNGAPQIGFLGGGGGGGGGGVTSFNGRTGVVVLSDTDVSTAGGMLGVNNLSDVATPATALVNIGGIGAATTNTLTNKTISGASNTLTNIGNGSLTNSSMSIAGNTVALGGTLSAATLKTSLSLGAAAFENLSSNIIDNAGALDLPDVVAGGNCGDGVATGCIITTDNKGRTVSYSTYSLVTGGTVTQVSCGLGMNCGAAGGSGGSFTTSGTVSAVAIPVTLTTSTTLDNTYGGKIIYLNAATPQTLTFPQAGVSGNLANGWSVNVENIGTACWSVIAVTSTITPGVPSGGVCKGQAFGMSSDGTNFGLFGLTAPILGADSIFANLSGSAAYGTSVAMSDCSASTSALGYSTTSHSFPCNTNIAKTNASNTFSALQAVNTNAGTLTTPQTGTLLQLQGVDNQTSRIELDAFGAVAAFTGVTYGGTRNSPSAITNGTQLVGFNAFGYNGTAVIGSLASLRPYAEEDYSVGHGGTQLCLATAPIGTTSAVNALCQHNDGGLTLGSPTGGDEGPGTINIPGSYYINGSPVGGGGTGTQMAFGQCTSLTTNATAKFCGASGQFTAATTENSVRVPSATGWTLVGVCWTLSAQPGSGVTHTLTTWQTLAANAGPGGGGGAATSNVVAFTNTEGAQKCDTTHTVSFAQGDMISFKDVVTGGTPPGTTGYVSIKFTVP